MYLACRFIEAMSLEQKVTFDNVLLYVDDKNVEIGQPYLSNVKVTAEVVDVVKSDKISILKF